MDRLTWMTKLLLQRAVRGEAEDAGVAVAVSHVEVADGGDGDAGGLTEVSIVTPGNHSLPHDQLRGVAVGKVLWEGGIIDVFGFKGVYIYVFTWLSLFVSLCACLSL